MGKTIKDFRFWCQKVLPLVYDDSLSYYEVLCKLKSKTNEIIAEIDSINDAAKDMQNQINQIEQNVDIKLEETTTKLNQQITQFTEEINEKLEKFESDFQGEFDSMTEQLRTEISTAINNINELAARLENEITEELDSTKNEILQQMTAISDAITNRQDQLESTIDELQAKVDSIDENFVKELLQESLATMIFLELTDDHIVFNIPTAWSNIQFNTTGKDIVIADVEYGCLVLTY